MEKTLTVASLKKLDKAASTILNDIGEHRVVALFGKMGAGKTTLIKEGLAHGLGCTGEVTSPTFALAHEYTGGRVPLFHFDFYSIESIEEVYDIGYEEYIYSGHFCFIEWPEMIMELLPESYVYLLIEETENGTRLITYRIPH